MATIEDLNIQSILGESQDEAIERLRQIRLFRRTPSKPVKKTSTRTASKSKVNSAIKNLDPSAIAELLKEFKSS
jgi:DNA-binding TFAR19-related protein (PDSD5 family)